MKQIKFHTYEYHASLALKIKNRIIYIGDIGEGYSYYIYHDSKEKIFIDLFQLYFNNRAINLKELE